MPGQAIVTIRDKQWTVGMATSYAELTSGLKGVAALPSGTGMLFIFGQEQPVTVTMQGMLFPLDIVFISGQLQVVDVARGAPPGILLSEQTPVKYFLEINAGEASGVEVGDVVIVIALPPNPGAANAESPTSSVVSLGAVLMTGVFMAKIGKMMANAMPGAQKATPALPAPSRESLLPQIHSESRSLQQGDYPHGHDGRETRRAEADLEFLADSPEFLAYTIDDIGYRDRIDTAFLEAIARSRRPAVFAQQPQTVGKGILETLMPDGKNIITLKMAFREAKDRGILKTTEEFRALLKKEAEAGLIYGGAGTSSKDAGNRRLGVGNICGYIERLIPVPLPPFRQDQMPGPEGLTPETAKTTEGTKSVFEPGEEGG